MFDLEPRYGPDTEDAPECADCGTPINDDRVYCARCEQERWQDAEPAYDGVSMAERMAAAYETDRRMR